MSRYFPTLVCMVSYPDMFEPGQGRTQMNRRHNTAVKDALKKCLLHHQRYNVPKHFQFGGHARYKYRERSERTKLIKSRLGKRYLDLVLRGHAKEKFTKSYTRLSVSGTTYNGIGVIDATMTITWPPGYYDNPRAKPGAIRKADMRDEIERWTPEEQQEMAELCLRFYIEGMRASMAIAPRLTKRFNSQLQAQGIT